MMIYLLNAVSQIMGAFVYSLSSEVMGPAGQFAVSF